MVLIIPDYDSQALAAPQWFRDGIQAAINILDATFTANITVKIAIGWGEIGGVSGSLPNQNTSEGGFLLDKSIDYSKLRSDLIKTSDIDSTSASLPNAQSVNLQTTFVISSAQERLFGLLPPVNNTNSDDGQIGIGTNFTGNVLISAALHEITHALGRTDGSSLDIFRFTNAGSRLFTGGSTAVPAYFSLDNGVTDLADFGQNSDPGDFLNPPAGSKTPNDPFNEDVGTLGNLTAIDIEEMDALGFSITTSWKVAASGDFAIGSNWSSGFVPVPAADARIMATGTYIVTSAAGETVASLATAKGATLAINGGTFAITNGTGTGANAGTIAVADGAALRLGGTVKNTGTIILNSVFVSTRLGLTSNVSLTGAGNVTLSDTSNNFIAAAVGAPPLTLTNVGNTISGTGSIGTGDGTLTLINDKIVNATGVNNALVIDTGNTVTNTGTMEATGSAGLNIDDAVNNINGLMSAATSGALVNLADGGNITSGKVTIVVGATLEATGGANTISSATVTDKGTLEATRGTILTLASTTVNAAGGVIDAADAILIPSQIALSNATINNGTLATEGGIIDTIAGTNSVLNGVTISTGSTVTVTDDSTLTLKGTINNDGTLALDSTGDATDLTISGNVNLQGGGDIAPSDDSNNNIVSNGSTAKLTNTDNTISGAGTIGDSNLTLVNKGTVDATGTSPLIINTGGNTITNAGTLEAAIRSTLDVEGVLKNTGLIETNGGEVTVLGAVTGAGTATIDGGTLEFGAASNVNTTFSASNFPGNFSFTTIDAPAAEETLPYSINDAGQIVGVQVISPGVGNTNFLYSDGMFTTLNDPVATGGTFAFGINDGGQIVGHYGAPPFPSGNIAVHGFLYNNGVYTPLDDPSANDSPGTTATGISNSGQIVGYYYDSNNSAHGFLYNNGTYTTLDDPLAGSGANEGTFASGINDAGQIVGYFLDSDNIDHGFLYSNGVYTPLDDPFAGSSTGSVASGINDASQIVGHYYDNNNIGHGFLYSNGVYTPIDDPSGNNSFAAGINDQGVVVGSYYNGGPGQGFIANVGASDSVLKLDDAPQYTGSISGFALGDSIDLNDINFTNLEPLKFTSNKTNTGGTLTVTDGTVTAHLALLGQYLAAGFQDAKDAGTGTVITYTPSGAQSNEATLATPQHT